MKSKITCLTITALLALTTAAQADFFNGFEGGDTTGWNGVSPVDTTVGTAPGMPTTASEGDWYGQTSTAQALWFQVGDSTTWPGGFTTSIDLYLDTAPGHNASFGWSSAIAADGGGTMDPGGSFVFSGSLDSSSDVWSIGVGETLFDPPTSSLYTIDASGWYTLQHDFYEDASNELSVRLSILDSLDNELTAWTLGGIKEISLFGGADSGFFYSDNYGTMYGIDNTSMTTAVVPVPGALLLAGFGLSCAGLHLRRRRS